MNKIILVTLAALSLNILPGVLVAPAQALSLTAGDANMDYQISKDKNNEPDRAGVWARPSYFAIGGVGTTCNLIAAGKGIVKGINAVGTTNDTAVLFDAAAVGSLSAATPDTTKLLAVLPADSSKYNGDYEFLTPIPYTAGLVVCPKSATVFISGRYHKQKI